MALSGVVLFGFSIVHALGTLQLFAGPERLTFYAALLRKVPALLWSIRIALLVSFVVHVWAAITLKLRAREARPIGYRKTRSRWVTSVAARSMAYTGLLLAAFLGYHLLHFTFGRGPWYDHQNVYNTMVYGFRIGWLTALYVVGTLLFGLHLYHGAWSWLDTLGLSHPRYNRFRKPLARGLAAGVTAAYLVQPVAVYAGYLEPTEQTFCYPELAKSPDECAESR
jgi:succinate dehydrogenase / fumarate reductase cytochrome b subunit